MTELPPCCAASRDAAAPVAIDLPYRVVRTRGPLRPSPADREGPVREIRPDAFRIDVTTVTNAAFAAFVDTAGWITVAERFGTSFVIAGFLPDDFPRPGGRGRAFRAGGPRHRLAVP